MGNRATRHLAVERRHVIESWDTIYQHDPNMINEALSEAWLGTAELTPTWIWALVDLPETMHADYKQNKHFMNIIQQVRDFLHVLIKVHKCEPETVREHSFRLGARHRHYMHEGRDSAYWLPFAGQTAAAITKRYFQVLHANKFRRILRIHVRGEKNEEELLVESWKAFINSIVESMHRGYEGHVNGKTPMRLSITASIISMASMRSGRSRSASHYLEPVMPLSPSTCRAQSVESAHSNNKSILRQRHSRSQDFALYRRVSSPNVARVDQR